MHKDNIWASNNFLSQRSLQHADSVRSQLRRLVERLGIDPTSSSTSSTSSSSSGVYPEAFFKCLAAGLFRNVARLSPHYLEKAGGKSAPGVRATPSTYSNLPNPSTPGKNEPSPVRHLSKFSDRYSRNKTVPLHSDPRSSSKPGGGSVVSSTGGNEEDSAAPYRTLVGGLPAYIHPSSVLFTSRKLPQYVVYSELLITSKRYMRGVTSIESVVSWFMAEKLADGNVFQ